MEYHAPNKWVEASVNSSASFGVSARRLTLIVIPKNEEVPSFLSKLGF